MSTLNLYGLSLTSSLLQEKFSSLPLEQRKSGTIVPGSNPTSVFVIRNDGVLEELPKLEYDRLLVCIEKQDQEDAEWRYIVENRDIEATAQLLDATKEHAKRIVSEVGIPDDGQYRIVSVLHNASLPIKTIKITLSERQRKKTTEEIEEICVNKGIARLYVVAREEMDKYKGAWLLYKGQTLIHDHAVVPWQHKSNALVVKLSLVHPVLSKTNHSAKPTLASSKSDVFNTDNIGCIFELEDTCTGEQFSVYLRRFSEDQSPVLLKGCESVSSDAPLGKALAQSVSGQSEVVCNETIGFRIISRSYYESKPQTSRRTAPKADLEEGSDLTKHANGHMARERIAWGSFPKHDQYGDESTGEERDYEEYPEYIANYED